MSSIARVETTDAAPPSARASQIGRVRASLGSLHGSWAFRALSLLSLSACVFGWHLLARHRVEFGPVSFVNVPPPGEVVTAAAELLESPKLQQHLLSSITRAFVGFFVAAVFGVIAGIAIARSRIARSVLSLPLEVVRPIPGVAWIPLSILIFKSSEVSMIYITFLGALFPILVNTIHGVDSIEQRYVQAAQGLGAKPWHLLWHVVIHGALPSIITGLSLGMGTSWFCLVTAEMIAGQYGIGYYTWESYNLQRYPEIVLGMLLIGVLGALSSAAVKRLGTLLVPWYRIQVGRHG